VLRSGKARSLEEGSKKRGKIVVVISILEKKRGKVQCKRIKVQGDTKYGGIRILGHQG